MPGLFLSRQNVALAAARAQELQGVAVVNLAAQALDVDFDEVREDVEVLVPDVRGDLCAAHDLVGVAREEFQERVLLVRKLDETARALCSASARVNFEVGDAQDFGTDGLAATPQGADAREQ